MTNIPKKLDKWILEDKILTDRMFLYKLNEIIDYLQAKEDKSYKVASSVCCYSSFRLEGDTKEGTMFYVCNNCNKACDIKPTEKKVEASKGERKVVVKHKGEYDDDWKEDEITLNPPESKGECICDKHDTWITKYAGCPVHGIDAPKYNPPEHEEQWAQLKRLIHENKDEDGKIGDLTCLFNDLQDLIITDYVSKEKLKREIVREAKWSYDNNEYNWSPTHLLKSLGLGD